MSRLPSLQQLDAMPDATRSAILFAFARDTREEVESLEAGIIRVEGATRASYLKSARRRLQRVYAAADHFKLYVEQPEAPTKPRIRVKAVGRFVA